MTTTTNAVDVVKASLRVVEQKRAAFNRVSKQADDKINEAKAKAEKAWADKIEKAEKELNEALEAFRAAADVFKNGEPVAVDTGEGEDPTPAELTEAI